MKKEKIDQSVKKEKLKNTAFPQARPPKKTTLGESARSNLWFYPGEELKTGEMRVTLIGTGWGNVVSPAQKGPSIFVELGNDAQDSFVFDVGPGCILNYNAMEIPMSRMNHIFLSHLHMDHCSDLPFIYAFGPNLGDRFTPLNIYGPSGPSWPPEGDRDDHDHQAQQKVLGTRNMVEGMKRFTQWHTTSFSTMTNGAETSYPLKDEGLNTLDDNIHEFDYRVCGGTVFERNSAEHGSIRISSFPALHIIDGAVSYRLEWTPTGQEKTIVMVYSGDTLPNEFMLEYGQNADLLIHETAPSIDSVINGANTTYQQADAIVSNSHTPAESLGYIFEHTQPQLGVTTHTPVDQRSIDSMITGVRKHWQGPYQIGADFMVFNIAQSNDDKHKSVITTRMGVPVERPWPVRIETMPDTEPPLADDEPYLRKAKSEKYKDEPYISGFIFSHELKQETPTND